MIAKTCPYGCDPLVHRHITATGGGHERMESTAKQDADQLGNLGMKYRRNRSFALLAATLCVAAIGAGCTSGSGAVRPLSFAPLSLPGGQSKQSTAILAALHGGILPADALRTLAEGDRLRALEAEYRALETAPAGQAVTWSNPGGKISGRVVAAAPYQVGRQNCRQYSHTAAIEGREIVGQGAACRNEDGSWTPLT